jgi:hypothetical protein
MLNKMNQNVAGNLIGGCKTNRVPPKVLEMVKKGQGIVSEATNYLKLQESVKSLTRSALEQETS